MPTICFVMDDQSIFFVTSFSTLTAMAIFCSNLYTSPCQSLVKKRGISQKHGVHLATSPTLAYNWKRKISIACCPAKRCNCTMTFYPTFYPVLFYHWFSFNRQGPCRFTYPTKISSMTFCLSFLCLLFCVVQSPTTVCVDAIICRISMLHNFAIIATSCCS
jgi:hypothetical protein